jgi:diguanylate cyclase (GGDEF)-like protein/PAS domain S-box-containing protein
MMIVDQERRVRKVSDSILQFTGRTEKEMLGLGGGEALRCVYHIDDPKGCGFGTACDTCVVRLTIEDTLKTGNNHHKVESKLSFIGDKFEERTLLISTVFIEHLDKQVAVYLEDITKRKQIEEALRESEEKLRNIIEHSNEIFYIHDTEHILTFVSSTSKDILGYTPEEMMRNWTELITDNPINQKGFEITQKAIETGERQESYLLEAKKKDSTLLFLEIEESPIKDAEGKVVGIIGAARDVTERKQSDEALRKSEERYRTVLEANPDPVVVYDTEGKVLYLNPAFTRVFGWSSKERFGKKMDVYVPEEAWSETKMMIDKVLAGEAFSGIETHRYTKEGKLIPVSISGATYRDLEGNHLGTVVNLRDISEQKSLEEKLERLSYLDGLTGVANRRQFDINLDLEWRRMGRLDKSLSLIMCDIDFFKAYNDTYGHQAGDKCLKAVGNVLKGSAKRAGDLVARYGGEEFTILLPMTDSEKAFIIAEKIQRDINSLKVPHKKSEVSDVVTLSFGIATLFPQTSKSPNDLVELADKALYRAKHEGRNKVIIS